MTISEIIISIQSDLEQYSNPERKKKIAIDHPTSMQVLGLKVPDQRQVIERWRKTLSGFTERQWIELSLGLINTDILECQQVAFEFLWKNKKALQALTVEEILLLGKNLDNWVSVDMYCMCITGFSLRTGKLQDEIIVQWAGHESHWIRRSALVSTVPLNLRARGGKGDVEQTLAICRLLVNDYDDMIVKAMSWALRELSKSDRQAVIGFLEDYQDQLHPRVKREVGTKLRTGKKNG